MDEDMFKNISAWDYGYFHKDHLGNSRVVYGYMKQVEEYKATMESALATQEDAAFKNFHPHHRSHRFPGL